MVDNVVGNLSNKLQDLKAYNKAENNKADNKSDFKSYLSKEVNNNKSDTKLNNSNSNSNTSENIDNESVDLEGDISNKELINKVSEKIEKILNNEDLNSDSLDEALNEVILLLLKLIEANEKDLNTINSDEINSNESKLIGELSNLSLSDNFNTEISKEDSKLVLNTTEDISSKDTKEVLNNINNILVKLFDNEDSSKLGTDKESINKIEADLLKEFKSLVNVLPEKTVKEVEKNLSSDLSKEIFSALLLETKNDINKKEVVNKEVINNDNDVLINTDTKINKNDSNSTLSDDDKENNSNDNTTSKNTVTNKEEKVLMKILEDDGDKSFSKVLNYYDKLNKTNPLTEVIKAPVVISKDSINLDFVKNIKYMVKNSVEELNVKIYPKELGEMTIKLISQEGIMKAEIKATSKETYNLLNSSLNDIKKTLENQNIRIQEVNIGIYNEDTTFFSGRDNSKEDFENQKVNKINGISLEEEEVIEDLLNEGNVNLLA